MTGIVLAAAFTIGLGMWAFGSDSVVVRIGQVLAVGAAAVYTITLLV